MRNVHLIRESYKTLCELCPHSVFFMQRAAEKTHASRMTRYAHHSTSCFVFRNARTRVRHRLEDGVMKRLLLATATTVALIAANAAQAADLGLPAKGPMAAPLPACFYAGLNAGYARSTTVWNDLDGTINGVSGVLVDESTNGFIGGGQI